MILFMLYIPEALYHEEVETYDDIKRTSIPGTRTPYEAERDQMKGHVLNHALPQVTGRSVQSGMSQTVTHGASGPRLYGELLPLGHKDVCNMTGKLLH